MADDNLTQSGATQNDSTEPEEPAEPFAHVAILEPHGEEAAEKLRTVHSELIALGASGDAERLLIVDDAAERGDLGMLERLITGEHSLDELSEIQHSRVRQIIGWRNAMALVPLLVTWLLLGWASLYYHGQIADDRGLATQPFLVLWQQRFGDMVIPTFAETALTAFVVLFVVLVLTTLAHRRESKANRITADIEGKLHDAMGALARAVEKSSIRPPVSAEEWAEAAQRVLTETQQMLAKAVADTEALAEANREMSKTAQDTMTELQSEARKFVATLAQETRETIIAMRADNAQLIGRTAEEAMNVLREASAANRKLIEQEMAPLFQGFRDSLEDYRADQELYRTSAAAMATGVTELTRSTASLVESAQSQTKTAESIDKYLRLVESSQGDFVAKFTENSKSMTIAATAMQEMTQLMSGRMRGDLETLARNVVDASARLATVDRDLAAASTAMNGTTRAMQTAAHDVAAAVRSMATSTRRVSRRGIFTWFRRSR